MNTKIFGGLLMIAVLATASVANADTVANHQHHKHKFGHRLKKDVRNGEITREDAKHFKMESKRIHAEKRNDIAKGTFTPAEHVRIHNEKKMLSHNLRKEEHAANNNKVRG
jgi:hypothetical protein